MLSVMRHNDISMTWITECSPEDFCWIECYALDNRTGKTEHIEMWINASDDDYKAKASRVLASLGYELNEVRDHHATMAEINSAERYKAGVLAEK